MKPIQAPIQRGNSGADVANLQEGLLILLRGQAIRVPPQERRRLETALAREQRTQVYDSATAALVGLFREQSGIPNREGDVDDATAAALNDALIRLGAFGPLQDIANQLGEAGVIARQLAEQDATLKAIGQDTDKLQDLEAIKNSVGQLQGIDQKLGEEGAIVRDLDEQAATLRAISEAADKLRDLEDIKAGIGQLQNIDMKLGDEGTIAKHLDAQREALTGIGDRIGGLGRDLFVVSGQVRQEDGLVLSGVRVRAVHEPIASPLASRVLRLGEDNTDGEGRFTIRYQMLPGVDGINLRVTVFDADDKPLHQSDVIHGAKPLESVDLTVPGVNIRPYRVDGKVVSPLSAGVGGLRVVIVDKGIGGDVQLTEATTNEDGAYQAAFSDYDVRQRGKAKPDLEARIYAGDNFLCASEPRFDASQHETLNVLLRDAAVTALPSEHEVLTSAMSRHFRGRFADLKESDEQQDITYLANKMGWDARAVALAALADQFSARTADDSGAPTIPQEFFYALFRAGLPANEDTLYHADAKTLEAVWKKAAEQGVIPKASVDRIPGLTERFQGLSAEKLLNGRALIGASSFPEMWTISNLNEAQQNEFARLYAANRADIPTFWRAIENDPVFGATPRERAKTVTRLRVDGKLGFLTINNAPLMQKLHATAGANGLSDPVELARTGYHRAEPWGELLTGDVPIPKEIPGDTPEAQRAHYAEYLAAQVRLSYPTAAVAHMVKSGDLPLTGAPRRVSDRVQTFLTKHQGKFEIGVQPVHQYIAQNGLQVDDETVKQVKRLERVYQITPSDKALMGLMRRGVDAAYHVVQYGKDTFVRSFAEDLGGADQAALTYDRSVHVHTAVLNIVLSYLTARTAPAIGVHSPSGVLDPAPANAADVIAYATMESLFGSIDYCAGDDSRSILSPAAYLVDLLLFLNSDPTVWSAYLETWKQDHADAPYPFADQAAWQQFQSDWNSQHPGQPLPNTEVSPFDVVVSRRPDIEHLPLTSENTNTALPYIDVVNETLEYFVANDAQKLSLKDYHGHDTNGVASEDLLASPQFVIDSAYSTLKGERFPTQLPFHQPLENLRRYFNKFEVPLALAMERLRETDDLERSAGSYGRRDILMEEIGLSRDAYEILTDSNAVPLWRMYGFADGMADADVIAGLSNAKQFARRVGITYEDLVSVLKTRFINPNSDLIPKLERLGVSFATLMGLKDGTIAGPDFDRLLAVLAVPPDPAEYDNDIKAWVKNGDNYARITGLITLAIPANPWAASTAYGIGDCVRRTAVQSEATLYYECTTPGMSASSEPEWPEVPGSTYGDETVVWTCRDASSSLSFGNLAFRYSDPAKPTQNIGAVEFARLSRFIRLWKKLGWTIEQTDAAICGLYRSDMTPLGAGDIDTMTKLDAGFPLLLPRLGIATRVMKALNLTVKRDLLPLLACWSEIGTHGNTALYRQMFLNPALLKQDNVFDDNSYGGFLTDTSNELAKHSEALRSAFNLTRDEYGQIVTALGYDTNAGLTIPNVSAIFRRGWLARKMKLSVRGLLLLIQLTGLDPFTALDPTDPAILRLIGLVQSMKDRSFKSAAALYLIWNQDLSGKSTPDSAQVAAFARSLRLDLAAVETEFAVADDPDGAIAQTRMARVYGADAAAFFFSLLNDTLSVEVPYSRAEDPLVTSVACSRGAVTIVSYVPYTHHQVALEQSILDAAPGLITYDHTPARLSFNGILSPATVVALRAAADGTIADSDARRQFQDAVDRLYEANQRVVKANLEQAVADTAPDMVYDESNNRLSFTGALSENTVKALKVIAVTAIADSNARGAFETALNRLYEENQKVIKANLEQPIVDVAPGHIAYDSFRKLLSYSGVLTPATRDALKAAAGAGAAAFNATVDSLWEKNQGIVGPFFLRYPELQSPYNAYIADTTDSSPEKRSNLLKSILPELVQRRKRQQALQSVSAKAKTDPAFTQALLNAPNAPYPLHAVGHEDQPALNDLLGLETPGLSAQFFASDTVTGTVIPVPDITTKLDYAPAAAGAGNPLPANPTPGAAISGVWRGYLEAPETGFFTLRIEADTGATVSLRLGDKDVALAHDGTCWDNTDPVELRAGTLCPIRLTVEKVRDVVRVQWDWTPKGQGRAVIPARYLYPAGPFRAFTETYVRFFKGASIAAGLGLTTNELAHFATHSDYHINGDGWLNALSVSGNSTLSTAHALLKPFEDILDFARIKAEISPDDESLLTVLKDPVTTTQNTDSLLFTITGWNKTSLAAVLARFRADSAGLGQFDLFRRVYDASSLVQKTGIAAEALIQATTNEPTGNVVRDLQASLRARYDAADWRDVVRPINDEMRSLQRDALVAYILHKMRSNPASAHIDTADKLFEYFLMDVQMEPVMQTSRIRHALSSVQLFVERCLMNLEPRVSPAAINVKQWEWMKRYRVWEANRKVYLFPENWLEPELRDDKSPFFKEVESELLQSDITEESAATALLNYLSKLEEVAKLEPCGIHYVSGDPAKRTGDVNHVVARTAGAQRKYYYRRYEYGYWTPWEQIKLDIEDNPVIPVVWNDRLFVFWLRVLKEGPDTVQKPFTKGGALTSLSTSDIKTDPPRIPVSTVLCWSEYYNGKWRPTRTSDVARPLRLGAFTPNAFDRSKLGLSAMFWTKGALRIIVSDEKGSGASFFLHNAFSVPELRGAKKDAHFAPKRNLETALDTLKVTYTDLGITSLVLDNEITDRTVQPNHPVEGDPWDAPFFYEDARHVFYVTASQHLVWVPQWDDFGVSIAPPVATIDIPGLVFEPEKVIPDPIGPIVRQPGFGLVDPSPVERYVTEDAHIHRGIGTSGTVRYGDTEIGLAGSRIKSIRTR